MIRKLALAAALGALAALPSYAQDKEVQLKISLWVPPAHALRVATWNLLAFDDAAVPARRPYMLQVLPGLDPDVMIVQDCLGSSRAAGAQAVGDGGRAIAR